MLLFNVVHCFGLVCDIPVFKYKTVNLRSRTLARKDCVKVRQEAQPPWVWSPWPPWPNTLQRHCAATSTKLPSWDCFQLCERVFLHYFLEDDCHMQLVTIEIWRGERLLSVTSLLDLIRQMQGDQRDEAPAWGLSWDTLTIIILQLYMTLNSKKAYSEISPYRLIGIIIPFVIVEEHNCQQRGVNQEGGCQANILKQKISILMINVNNVFS